MKIRKVCIALGLLYFSVQVILTSCATVGSPTGGPKDTIPPRLVHMNPEYGTLNFKGKKIKLEFSEAIQQKDLQKQLIITPSIEGKYDPHISKNILELEFEEEFSDSTTYTFAFREGIADLNEGNPAKDLMLAFSTGNYMDSLSINGYIRDIMTGNPIDDALVSLYRAPDTFNIFNFRPYYLAKANKEGFYQFSNLKAGNYLIYAVKDANNNLKADSRSEPFGFIKDTLNLRANIDSIDINLLRLNVEPMMINNARSSGRYYLINLNKPVKDYQLEPLESTGEKLYSNLVEENKRIRIYNTFQVEDSLATLLTAFDSLGQQVTDTLYIKFEESRRSKEEFNTTVLPKAGPIEEIFTATITFNKPVKTVNMDSLFFKYDSLTIVRPEADKNFTWNSRRDQLKIKTVLNAALAARVIATRDSLAAATAASASAADTAAVDPAAAGGGPTPSRRSSSANGAGAKPAVELYAGKGAFISVEDDSSAVQEIKYTFAEAKNFGIIEGTFQSEHENFIVQLLDAAKFGLVKEIRNKHNFLFKMVPPGDYRIRILVDANGNGQWDPGNIHERIEPEPVIIMEDKITLKANWEIRDILISE